MAILMLLPLALQAAAAASAPATPPGIAITAPTAAEVAGRGDVRRLTPDQADAAIEAGAATHRIVNPDDLAIAPPPRGIHGEIGAEIGTRGERAVYGAATVPVGENAQASVAFAQSRSPRLHGW